MATKDADASMAIVLKGGVAEVVYHNAVAALPHDLQLRLGCLDAVQEAALPGSQSLVERIHIGIAADFGQSEEAWDLRARRATHAQVCGKAMSHAL